MTVLKEEIRLKEIGRTPVLFCETTYFGVSDSLIVAVYAGMEELMRKEDGRIQFSTMIFRNNSDLKLKGGFRVGNEN